MPTLPPARPPAPLLPQATNHYGSHSFFTTSDEQQWAAVRKAAAVAFNSGNVKWVECPPGGAAYHAWLSWAQGWGWAFISGNVKCVECPPGGAACRASLSWAQGWGWGWGLG